MARRIPRGIKQPHPLGSVASRSGISPLTVVAVSSASTGVKISDLPVALAASDTDQMEVNQGGVSKRLTLDQVASLVGTELTDDYLPLAGGTLTGSLTGTTAAFSGEITAATPITADNDTTVATTAFVKAQSYLTTTAAGTTYLPLAGGTLTGTLTGTTATFSSNVTVNGNAAIARASDTGVALRVAGATNGLIVTTSASGTSVSGTDSSGVGSFQPLILGGSVVNVTVPLTGTTATFSGTVTAPGAQIQMVSTQTGAVATGTTTIPADDTIPQITEGDQYMSLSITPKSATSKLNIDVSLTLAHTVASNLLAALFQDSTANALAGVILNNPTANGPYQLRINHTMTSGTTSATTFRVRAGSGSAGTTTFNGGAGARFLGGVMASSIVIREVAT